MRITPEQESILNSFVCERLSADEDNARLIQSFISRRGKSIVEYLKQYGLAEDEDGRTTYYIIKTQENEILMFFSMKCGVIFDPLFDESEVERDLQRFTTILQALDNAADNNYQELEEILNKYKLNDKMSVDDIYSKTIRKKFLLKNLSEDKRKEQNSKILRVQNTHPGIELVHFCTNDSMREKWNSFGLNHPMGETLYWKFIANKFFEAQNIVGCEYAFLFAADLSIDGSLVNYYDVSLKFQKRHDIGTNKPFYDFCCEFMCQEVNEMKKRQIDFFDNFNIDEDDIVI